MPVVSFRPIILAVVLASAASACVSDDEPTNELSLDNGGGFGYVGNQGRSLLGFKDPEWRMFSFTNMTGVKVIANGELVSDQATGASMKNATISAGTVEMRIVEAQSPVNQGDRWLYRLEQKDPATGVWTQACNEWPQVVPPFDPQPSPPYAIAMNGWFLPDGGLITVFNQVTLACKTGVVAKADSWGYGVDTTWPSVTENGLPVNVGGRDMMQAATRMARADYCGQGLPNTLDGTPIHIDDVFTDTGSVDGYYLEAAWPGSAAQEYPGTHHQVLCLSKLRWSTLPLGGTCPLVVPDPRVDSKWKFCEDISFADLERGFNGIPGARTYSYTAFLDAGLYNYFDLTTLRRLATSHLQPQSAALPPAWIPSAPGSNGFPAQKESVWLDATIFQPTLPPNILVTGLKMLSSFNCGSSLVTTTSGSTCPKIFDEGQVYPVNTTGRPNLRRWIDDHGYSFTTTASPWTLLAAGYHLAENLGGAIRGQNDVNLRWAAVTGATYTLDVTMRGGEQILGCLTTTQTTATLYSPKAGSTPTCASGRSIDHNDIAALTLTATASTGSYTVTVPYDGIANDVYFQLANLKPIALHLSWTNLGPTMEYAVSFDGDKCFYYDTIRNDVSRVAYKRCPSSGNSFKPTALGKIEVCYRKIGSTSESCVTAAYNHTWSQFVTLKQ